MYSRNKIYSEFLSNEKKLRFIDKLKYKKKYKKLQSNSSIKKRVKKSSYIFKYFKVKNCVILAYFRLNILKQNWLVYLLWFKNKKYINWKSLYELNLFYYLKFTSYSSVITKILL